MATARTRKPKVEGGSIVLFPLYDGRYVVTKVLFASRLAKDLILLGVTKTLTSELSLPRDVDWQFVRLIYMSNYSVQLGLWPLVGQAALSAEEQSMSLRMAGGEVWVGDEKLRKATSEDRKKLPEETVYLDLAAEIEMRAIVDPDNQEMRDRDAGYARAYFLRGRALSQLGQLSQAIKYFDAGLRHQPENRDLLTARAETLEQAERS
jgi:tetratricopeptide (TPR) repeat protein